MALSRIARHVESRRYPRYPVAGGMVRLLWTDGTRERMLSAKVLNVSVAGVCLLLDERLPVRAQVLCGDAKLGISGSAVVRYCNPSKGRFQVGLEFPNGSGWRAAQDGAGDNRNDRS